MMKIRPLGTNGFFPQKKLFYFRGKIIYGTSEPQRVTEIGSSSSALGAVTVSRLSDSLRTTVYPVL